MATVTHKIAAIDHAALEPFIARSKSLPSCVCAHAQVALSSLPLIQPNTEHQRLYHRTITLNTRQNTTNNSWDGSGTELLVADSGGTVSVWTMGQGGTIGQWDCLQSTNVGDRALHARWLPTSCMANFRPPTDADAPDGWVGCCRPICSADIQSPPSTCPRTRSCTGPNTCAHKDAYIMPQHILCCNLPLGFAPP